MNSKRPYTYVLLRYRHDSLAGEFANIGVVLHEALSGYLGVRVRHTLGRISRLFPDLDAEAFKVGARSIERSVRHLSDPKGEDLFVATVDASSFAKRAMPADDSSFIWGPTGSGITGSPEEELQKLYTRFVGRYDERPAGHRDDAAIWKPVRDLLTQRRLVDRLQAKVISSPVDKVEFEHAWKNGKWHCYQPLSFDLSSEENIREKAARWTGHMMALSKGSEAFKPHFLVGQPTDKSLMLAYDAAIEILKLSPIEAAVFEEARIEALVDQIEDEMRAHSPSSSNES